jgi:hypothetical protein
MKTRKDTGEKNTFLDIWKMSLFIGTKCRKSLYTNLFKVQNDL